MSARISDYKVMRSAAGWYIGRSQDGMPYSRDSGYFATEAQAQQQLDKLNQLGQTPSRY